MMGGKSWDEWISEYSRSHQNPVNRACHTLGIPLIALSIILFVVALVWRVASPAAAAPTSHVLWPIALGMFVLGWLFQFVGHAVEGKPPEFLHDWRFLFVGLRWWLAKLGGRA
jgi:uncharacterized membrane protein YGL010W